MPAYIGHELVTVLPFYVRIDNQVPRDSRDVKLAQLPASTRSHTRLNGQPPSPADFRQALVTLSQKYREIIIILLSSHLTHAVQSAQEVAATVKCPAAIHVVDSQTTSVGLGLLVQAAAEAAQNGMGGAAITQMVRGLMPHIYTIFCVQSLTYLSNSGHIDPAQAIIGEMLGISPLFILEGGRLTPIQKARSSRHLIDLLLEFVAEFEQLKHIALIQGAPPFDQEAHALRERITDDYRAASISEHSLSAALATIIGPRSLGVVVMENGFHKP
jgi:DegV family protein with EDD domain